MQNLEGKSEDKVIRVGSRKSELALIQTKYVISCLKELYPHIKFEIHKMSTMGDRVLNVALPKIGEKSLFTKDLEEALTTGGVDFVVHSLKDLPTALPMGMAIGAVLERENPNDVLILNKKHAGKTLQTLPEGSVIGTSSLRRSAQLARSYKHLKVCDIRGNLNTRLAKLDADETKFDGIILAHAGVTRMGWENKISQVLEPDEILYAVGQGALAVECRSNDDYILAMLGKLCHMETQCRILAERSFLKTLGGGCSAPVAVHSILKRPRDGRSELEIIGAVWSLDGKEKIQDQVKCELNLLVESDNNNSPRKKLKTSNDTKIENKGNLSPPKVIDDSLATTSKLGGGDATIPTVLMKTIISIHGDSIKKCPYSSTFLQEANSDNDKILKSTEDVHGDSIKKCPFSSNFLQKSDDNSKVNSDNDKSSNDKIRKSTEDAHVDFPIGQDVMGECPQFGSLEEKLKASNLPGASCPALECPYYVSKIIDYKKTDECTVPTLIDHTDQLYCGMHRHKSIKKDVFDACEALGIQLANNLISKGALEVMHCAQDEIHSKIPGHPPSTHPNVHKDVMGACPVKKS